MLYSRRLDALSDFQNLYKTDTLIFPTQLVTWLVDSLYQDERKQADGLPELQRLILKVSQLAHSSFQSCRSTGWRANSFDVFGGIIPLLVIKC